MPTDKTVIGAGYNGTRTLSERNDLVCPVCGSPGNLLYKSVKDRLFGVPGEWNIAKCSNPACQTLWLCPRPEKKEIPEFYKNYYTHNFLGNEKRTENPNRVFSFKKFVEKAYLCSKYKYCSNFSHSALLRGALSIVSYIVPSMKSSFDFSVVYLPASENGRLLDVGCGNGWLLIRMKSLGWNAEGVDFDEETVKIARKNGLKVKLGSLQEQHYPDDFFDAITAVHLVEHLSEPLKFVEECKRILKPGGKLILITPNSRSFLHAVFKVDWRGLEPPRHLQVFTPSSLEKLVNRSGFSDVKVLTSERDAAGMFKSSLKLKYGNESVLNGKGVRLLSLLVKIVESILVSLGTKRGEEIVLIGTK